MKAEIDNKPMVELEPFKFYLVKEKPMLYNACVFPNLNIRTAEKLAKSNMSVSFSFLQNIKRWQRELVHFENGWWSILSRPSLPVIKINQENQERPNFSRFFKKTQIQILLVHSFTTHSNPSRTIIWTTKNV